MQQRIGTTDMYTDNGDFIATFADEKSLQWMLKELAKKDYQEKEASFPDVLENILIENKLHDEERLKEFISEALELKGKLKTYDNLYYHLLEVRDLADTCIRQLKADNLVKEPGQ
jgi:hypothetical protein